MIKEPKYSGKKVFLGIDVHSNKYVICAICEDVVVKTWSTTADAEDLICQFLKHFQGASLFSVYEAGFSGFSLHRLLTQHAITNIIVNPASIETESNSRVKTDKRDAKKLAEHLSGRRLRGIYVPSEEEDARRSLSRGREQAVNRKKAIGNQLKMKLHYLGFVLPKSNKISEIFIAWVLSLKMLPEHSFVIRELIEAWRDEHKRVKRFEKELNEQGKKDELNETLRSVPGVGLVIARVLSNELGDMSRFKNERQLFSSTGLTPGEYSSGAHTRRGHISRRGSARIRSMLVEMSWLTIKKDENIREFYLRLARKKDSKKAIVAVARKILGRIRHCLMNRVNWQNMPLAKA